MYDSEESALRSNLETMMIELKNERRISHVYGWIEKDKTGTRAIASPELPTKTRSILGALYVIEDSKLD
jgi:hypothetical protein